MGKREKRIIGRAEIIALPDLGLKSINAKVDTGAYRSSLHCKKVWFENSNLWFSVLTTEGYSNFSTENWSVKNIRSSNGKVQERYIIKTKLSIFQKTYMVSFSLSDRSKMKYPVLLGRKFLKNRFVVDVSQQNVSANDSKL